RELKVYDSFEGLPPPTTHDIWPEGLGFFEGVYKGALEEVTDNVRRLGVPEVCEFRKGWFKDTLPHHKEPVALAVVDVDYHSSLYDCVTMLWSHLSDSAYFFIDEYVFTDYCALFFSEKFWRTHFQCDPPGLFGSGTGVQVGEYYLGPWSEMWMSQNPASIAYTRKGMKAVWEYYPAETPPELRHPEMAGSSGAPAV
ncbi:MAG TPA: TylF/MycF/NovP-related O-methyltransferase, partial [Polyangiaceae bacterium]